MTDTSCLSVSCPFPPWRLRPSICFPLPLTGNSDFTRDLFNAGFTNVTSIDVSAVVINQMQQRYADLEGADCKSAIPFPCHPSVCVCRPLGLSLKYYHALVNLPTHC